MRTAEAADTFLFRASCCKLPVIFLGVVGKVPTGHPVCVVEDGLELQRGLLVRINPTEQILVFRAFMNLLITSKP